MPPPYTLTYGGYGFLTEPEPVFRRRWDGLDEGTLRFWAATDDYVSPDDTVPGFPGMKARDVTITPEAEGFLLSVQAVGIYNSMGPSARRVAQRWTPTDEGFDEGSETWLTVNPNSFTLGLASTAKPNMVIVGSSQTKLDESALWYRVEVAYKGVISAKGQKVRLSTAAREISKDSIIVDLPGGWTTARKGQVMMPRAQVESSYVTNGLPTMDDVPSAKLPPVDPGVFNPDFSSPDGQWHWPNGWVLSAREAENLNGTDRYFVRETYIFNPQVTFG